MHRRRFLESSLAALCAGPIVSHTALANTSPAIQRQLTPALEGEDLVHWIERVHGGWNQQLWQQMLGAANDFKEGDAIVGVAAHDEDHRNLSRSLLRNTRLSDIDAHAPHQDELFEFALNSVRSQEQSAMATSNLLPVPNQDAGTPIDGHWTLGRLAEFLLTGPVSDIHTVCKSLSSDVIATVVRILSNRELTQIGSRIFVPLGNSRIGSEGYLGARIQPNSPTDHPDDIRWQIFNAFSYGVGDVLVGTNPVSSEPEIVTTVERTIQDLLITFGIDTAMPHCVLAHVDIQAEVERRNPGSTEFWFQSIAGNDSANATFDISVKKMADYAQQRTGRFGLYFETGQGADFTNGHGHGVDMVTFESRKYGFARALKHIVGEALLSAGKPDDARHPWVHLNDVAGFIGPEVFRTREQLVRCCLEDIVMGKLHGLTIGLDICTTLHMDVTIDDLGWCIDQIMPACPAYLMALPTRIDPMLGYLTTSFQDHVRIRQKFGCKVNDVMWSFFQSLGVIDEHGQPTNRFGDPSWVYLNYCRRRGDSRDDSEILAEAHRQINEVRARGVFISEGYGASPDEHAPELASQIQAVYQDARKCIREELSEQFVATIPNVIALSSQSVDREDYILHPSSGEVLSVESRDRVLQLRETQNNQYNVQIVISDGLNALAVSDEDQLERLTTIIRSLLDGTPFKVAPDNLLVKSGRVRAGYRIGELLFGSGEPDVCTILHIIGERPGSGHHTMSVYLTATSRSTWSTPGKADHNITRVVSGIANTALHPEIAAGDIVRILRQVAQSAAP
ncbi:MAG: ethanolamine ammonia-lyase subunit EutB [Planctomyces sp.]|nr:ethanolamine ammonia-lyase subunit EutB [Planctomyces sp.]